MIKLDAAAYARFKAAWLDPDIKLVHLTERFGSITKNYKMLCEELGPRPDTTTTLTPKDRRKRKKKMLLRRVK